MTDTHLTLMPRLTPLRDVADRLGIPLRRLTDRARGRQFTHVRIGKERYFTDDQLEAFIASFTVASDRSSTREADLAKTRERVARRVPRQRRPAA